MKLNRTTAIIVVAGSSLLSAAAQSAPGKDQAASGTAQATGKSQVQAKNQAEYDAYQAIKSKAQTPDEFEKAVDDFAAKFPDSNLRVVLYRGVMKSFQQADNADKMMTAGLKVLTIDKDDPEALIVVAEIQEEHTSTMDLDREERMDQAVANAQHALQTIDTDLWAPAGTQPERLEAYKKYLRSTALAIVGTIQYKRAQYPDAEGTLRKAIDADAANPDAVVVLRLALALDQQKKYQDALQQANRAVDLTKEDTEAGKSARSERDRLVIETGGNNTPASNPPVNNAPVDNAPLNNAPPSAAPPSATAPVNVPQNAPPQSSASPSH
jgi:tetratricopeptide (TPR) repeat protein